MNSYIIGRKVKGNIDNIVRPYIHVPLYNVVSARTIDSVTKLSLWETIASKVAVQEAGHYIRSHIEQTLIKYVSGKFRTNES